MADRRLRVAVAVSFLLCALAASAQSSRLSTGTGSATAGGTTSGQTAHWGTGPAPGAGQKATPGEASWGPRRAGSVTATPGVTAGAAATPAQPSTIGSNPSRLPPSGNTQALGRTSRAGGRSTSGSASTQKAKNSNCAHSALQVSLKPCATAAKSGPGAKIGSR